MKNSRYRYRGGKSNGAHSPRVKHGYYTKSAIEEREWLRELLKDVDDLLDVVMDRKSGRSDLPIRRPLCAHSGPPYDGRRR